MTRKINYTSIPTEGLVYQADLDGGVPSGSSASNVTWVDADRGYVKECGSFNGSSSYVNAGIGLGIGNGDFTINTSINYISNGARKWIFDFYETGAPRFALWVDSTGNLTAFANPGTILTGATILVSGNNYMITLTRTGGNIEIFINNVSDGTTSGTFTNAGSNFGTIIGRRWENQNENWNSKIGLFKYYNRVLNKNERQSLLVEVERDFGPTNAPLSGNFPKYSLPNLEEGKVLEYSRPQNGGSYINQTGSGVNGTATNVVDSTNGMYNVMGFNGSNSEININSIGGFNEITIKFKFILNSNVSGAGLQSIYSDESGGAGSKVGITIHGSNYHGNNSEIGFFIHGGNLGNAWANMSLVVGKAYNVVCTCDGITSSIYIDGILKGTFDVGGGFQTVSHTSKIGRNSVTTSRWLNGKIMDFMNISKSLTETEVRQDFYSSKLI